MRVLRQCLLLALYLFDDIVVSGEVLLWLCPALPLSSFQVCIAEAQDSVAHAFPSIRSILALLMSSPVGFSGLSIPDGVASLQADPLGDGPVLLLGLGQLLLGAERLVGLSQC